MGIPDVERPRELTARALIFGCVAGALLSAGNVYTGLKTGFVDGGSITTALVAFAFFAVVKRLSPASFGARENNIAQTTAASAAVMGLAIGLTSAIPALTMMGHSYPGWALSAWGMATGVIGILVASKLRQKLVREERLPFPTGAATAEVIETIGAARQTSLRRALLLIGTAIVSIAFVWFRDGRPAVIPQAWMFDVVVAGTTLSTITVGLSYSPLMLSIGLLIGERVAFSMLAGATLSWVVLAPRLIHLGLIREATYSACNAWLIWPGVGMLLAGSFVPLLFDWRGIARGFRDAAGVVTRRSGSAVVDENTRLPFAKSFFGIAVALLLVIAIGVFHVDLVVAIVGLASSLVLANVCGRTAGETDLAPTGAFGTLTQLSLTGHGVVGSVVGGTIVAGAAAQTSQTLWAFKTGDRFDASPRAQLTAQLLGCFVGGITAVPAYDLLVRAHGIATVALPAPSALSWKATAEAVQHGISALPPYSALGGLLGFAAGTLFSLLSRTRAARLMPSAAAMGMAMITPFSLSMTAAVGGVILIVARRFSRRGDADAGLMAIAAGGIAGESIIGVVIAALVATGVLSPG